MKSQRKTKPKRTRIPKENLLRPMLQKEIGSRCPFCTNEEVSHFEIHHIDEDRVNHQFENLLLICRTCHSKFTKKVWEPRKAIDAKRLLLKIADFKKLESSPLDEFDYDCYGMLEDDGRIPSSNSNGSKANIRVVDLHNIEITLRQSDGRTWKGELLLKTRAYGELSFVYKDDDKIEVGRRECYILQKSKNGYREDIFFFKPLTNTKDYRDEVFIRMTPDKDFA